MCLHSDIFRVVTFQHTTTIKLLIKTYAWENQRKEGERNGWYKNAPKLLQLIISNVSPLI